MRGTSATGERGWNLLGWAICALQVPVLAIVSAREDARATAVLACAVACAAVVLALGVAMWIRLRRDLSFPTLTWPIVAAGVYAAFGLVEPEATALLPGMVTLCFVYIGLTQRRWTACWFVLLALPAYVIGAGGPGSTSWATVPLVVVMWLFIGEVPAALLDRLHRQSAQLAEMASTDALTGLLNRAVLVEDLSLTSAADTVVIVDLDEFKLHNDQHGHVAGDAVLTDLATALAGIPGGRWFRYGGDEFVGIFAEHDPDAVRAAIDEVREIAAQPQVQFSVGFATGGPQALERADADLYRAKAARRPLPPG